MNTFLVQLPGESLGRLKLLITGASGLLGGKLVQLATDAGHDVHSLYFEHSLLEGRPQRLDITDRTAVENAMADKMPEVMIHAASITDLDLCERTPELAFRVNATATGFLAEACQKVKSRLIYLSTDYIFDGKRGNYRENDKPNPVNVYGKSKLLGEEEIARKAGDFCIARTSVLFGWGRRHRPNFATWVHGNLRAGQRINVVTDQYATPTLSSDLARMLLEAAERRLNGIFHLSGSTRVNRYEFALLLARKFGFDEQLVTPVKAESINWIARRPFDSSLNVSKAQASLNNRPSTLEKALNEFAADAHARPVSSDSP
jgi:dTDP-4-dehydrorhamnose reductase